MIDAGVTPDLMTRFREEVYATRAHKAWVKRNREDYWLLPGAEGPGPYAVRVEYYAKSRQGYRKISSEAAYQKPPPERLM